MFWIVIKAKRERSLRKIEWAGAGGPRSGNGAKSECHKRRLERWAANRPLTLRSQKSYLIWSGKTL